MGVKLLDKRDVIRQLEEKELEYNDLNNLQMWLFNNNYIPIGKIVFEKKELFDEESVFYFNNDKELWEAIEKGNGKFWDREYCQIVNGGLYFYNLNMVEDIILNIILFDCLGENVNENSRIFDYLNKKFGVKIE